MLARSVNVEPPTLSFPPKPALTVEHVTRCDALVPPCTPTTGLGCRGLRQAWQHEKRDGTGDGTAKAVYLLSAVVAAVILRKRAQGCGVEELYSNSCQRMMCKGGPREAEMAKVGRRALYKWQ